ncbi:MAG TPA: TonB-dependent receptor, partial [Vicinamibacterales bacterium]|nr:TonB-dependent receptor [Vicinamibacterales bacterium]
MSSIVLALLVASSATAQSTANGSIHGVATDQNRAVLPGVTVTASSATVPGTFTSTTDTVGQFLLANLPPGEYTIVAELSGFTRVVRTPVTVRAGLNVEANFSMAIGRVEETVEVRENTPLLETRNGAQAVNVSGALLRGIPLSEGREWFGALSLVPGVNTADFSTSKLIFVGGADQSANVVQVDGADVGTAANFGVAYLSLSTDAVDDIQIKTSGVDAAAPLGVGGVINIATASGTNVIHGAATTAIHPSRWNDSNVPGGTSSTADQRQLDLSGGGPLLKDHLWGFVAYRYSRVSAGISRTAQQLATLRALVPGFTPFDSVNRSNFVFAKLTAQPSNRQRLSGFYQRDVNPTISAIATAINATRQATGGAALSTGLSSVWSNRLTTQVTVSYNNKRRRQFDPGVDGPFQRVFSNTLLSGGRLTGVGQLAVLDSPTNGYTTAPDRKATISSDATLFIGNASGSHELRGGLYAQDRLRGSDIVWINDGFTIEDVVRAADGALVPFHRTIIDGTHITSFRQRTRDYAGYVQDAWRPTTRLTINAGLRVDRIETTDLVFHLRAQNSTEVGPRLAATYALTNESRDVLRAHWVKVQDQPGLAAISGSTSLAQRDLYDLNLDGSFETVFTTPATFA